MIRITNIYKPLFCFFYLSFAVLFCQAQHPSYWQYTSEDGLPCLTIYDLHIDQNGFLWMGTDYGISKYVSNNFLSYKVKSEKGFSLTNLQEDSEGNIWCQNFAGDFFKINNDTIAKISVPDPAMTTVRTIYFLDKKDRLHVALKNQIIVKDSTSNIWKTISPQKTKKNFLYDFVLLSDSEYIIPDTTLSTHYSLYNTATQQLTPLSCHECEFDKKGIKNIIKIKKEVFIYEEKYQNDEGYIYKLEGHNFKRINIPSIHAKINNISIDRENNYWISTYSGTYGFDKNFKPLLNGIPLFEDKITTDLVQDHENNYWISTLKSGLLFIPNININTYYPSNSNITDERINCLSHDQEGNLFLGLNNGLINKLNLESGEVKILNTNTSVEVLDLVFHENRNLLYAGLAGLYVFNSQQLTPIQKVPMGSVKKIDILDYNNIITATSSGAFILNSAAFSKSFSQKSSVETNQYSSLNLVQSGRSRSILKDQQDESIWIGNNSRLVHWKSESKKNTIQLKGQNVQVTAMAQTKKNKIWVGTLMHGLLSIQSDQIVQQLDLNHQLNDLIIKNLVTDNENIWIGTNDGLFYFDTHQNHLSKIDQFDGIPSNEINDILIYQDKIWLATLKGLVSFPKDYIFNNNTSPKVFIKKIEVNNQLVSESDLLQLNFDENNIRVHVEGVSFKSRGKYHYLYRMNNYDTSFTRLSGSISSIHFPALHYGNYTIEIFAENEDGIRSTQAAKIFLNIAPPFWRTWYFQLLALLILSLGLYIFIRRILKNIEKRNEIINAFRNSRMTALKAQMNPHFLFNALNSIQDYIISNEKRLANSYLGKFADLMRRILQMSDKDFVNLRNEMESLQLYLELESLRFEDSFEFNFKIDPQIDLSDTEIPPMIIQPYLENAIKHGLLHKKKNRQLNITLEQVSEATLKCIIDDNGIGRKASNLLYQKRNHQHESFASGATESRLKLLNKVHQNKIGVEYIDKEHLGKSLGTTVIINIPINRPYSFGVER